MKKRTKDNVIGIRGDLTTLSPSERCVDHPGIIPRYCDCGEPLRTPPPPGCPFRLNRARKVVDKKYAKSTRVQLQVLVLILNLFDIQNEDKGKAFIQIASTNDKDRNIFNTLVRLPILLFFTQQKRQAIVGSRLFERIPSQVSLRQSRYDIKVFFS